MTAGWICTKCGTQSTRMLPLPSAALVAERRRVTGSNIMSDRDLHMAAILMASYATRFGPSVHFWQAPV